MAAIDKSKLAIFNYSAQYRVYDFDLDTWAPAAAPWSALPSAMTNDGWIKVGSDRERALLVAACGDDLHAWNEITENWDTVVTIGFTSFTLLGTHHGPTSTGKPCAFFGQSNTTGYNIIEKTGPGTFVNYSRTKPAGSASLSAAGTRHGIGDDGSLAIYDTSSRHVWVCAPSATWASSWTDIGQPPIFNPGIAQDIPRGIVCFAEDDIFAYGRHISAAHWDGNSWTRLDGITNSYYDTSNAKEWVFDRDNIYVLYTNNPPRLVKFSADTGWIDHQTPSGPPNHAGRERIWGLSKDLIVYTQDGATSGSGEGLWIYDVSAGTWTITAKPDGTNNFFLNSYSQGFAHETIYPLPPPTEVSADPAADVLALNVVRIKFGLNVAITDALQAIDSYTITAVTSGADPVEIKGITGVDFEDDYLTYVDLVITTPTEGATYQVEATGLVDEENRLVIDNSALFLAHKTKTDSIIEGFPRTYSTTVEGTLRGILAAISLEDELIGGLENIDG